MLPDALLSNPLVVRWALIVAVGSLIVSVVLIPLIIARLPPDYFTRPERPLLHPTGTAHVLWPLVIVLKNALGLAFVAIGLLLLVLPGQGLLTILVGLMMVDFPGKFRLERWLVSRPGVQPVLNRFRRLAGAEPLHSVE